MNNQLNNKKDWLIKGKITKSYITFSENKPNSPIVQTDITSFITMNYVIFTSLTKVKNKPNTNPIKAKTNPIQTQSIQRLKINLNQYNTKNYENFSTNLGKKTNPNKANFYTIGCVQTTLKNWELMRCGRTPWLISDKV